METVELNSDTCRICLRNNEDSHSVYDVVQYEEGKEMNILEIVDTVSAGIESFSKKLVTPPTRICLDCAGRLFSAFELMRMMENSHSFLLSVAREQVALDQFSETKTEIEVRDNCDNLNLDIEVKNEAIHEEALAETQKEQSQDEAQEEEARGEALEEANEMEDCFPIAYIQGETSESYSEELIVYALEELQRDETDSKVKNSEKKSVRLNASGKSLLGSRLTHPDNMNWHKCEQCNRSFAKRETLENHTRAAHPLLLADEIEALAPKPTDSQPIKCSHCPRNFARQDNLNRHLKAVHKKEANDELDQSEKKQHTYKRGLCPYCGQSFSQASLAVHIRRHTGENPYKCKDCKKEYPRRQDLIIHQRQHTGERPHVCTICGKSFIRPNKLTRHLRIHTGQRPYKCTECDKTFSQSNDLKIHLRRHSGEKPYKCGICEEGFICGSKLNNHRKLRSHYEIDGAVDPYAKCRVNNRINAHVIETDMQDISIE